MENCNINSSCTTESASHKHKCCSDNITDNIKCLAEKAWAELLKEKIKKQYENKIGSKMDKIAEVAADAAIDYWKHKIAAKESCKEQEAKLHNVLVQDK